MFSALLVLLLQGTVQSVVMALGRSVISPRGLVVDEFLESVKGPGDYTKKGIGGSSRTSVCTMYPTACVPPFNCSAQSSPKLDISAMHERIATTGGHANLHAWCSSVFRTDFIEYVNQCLKGNMLAAADLVYNVQLRLQPDGGLLKADADYCRAMGHCTNTEVTRHTTLEQAEAMCDRRYTRTGWTTLGIQDLLQSSAQRSQVWGQLACAMGNFHCDVMYCRLKHCNAGRRTW